MITTIKRLEVGDSFKLENDDHKYILLRSADNDLDLAVYRDSKNTHIHIYGETECEIV
jgi:hypothetical protein